MSNLAMGTARKFMSMDRLTWGFGRTIAGRAKAFILTRMEKIIKVFS